MKRKLFLPFVLLASLAIVFTGCDPVEDDEFCDKFDVIEEVAPQCEIPSVCCPDDGTECYILAQNGDKYMCNKSTATSSDTNGCNVATNSYIDDKCGEGVTALQRAQIIERMNDLTVVLMAKAREYSICH